LEVMMRKLLCILALGLAGLGAPAAAELGWSEFVPLRRGHETAYLYLVTSEHGRPNPLPSRHEGYFHQGGAVDVRDGRASFDYDRDYPYDYPSSTFVPKDEEMGDFREPSCTVERVRDGKRGWADIRICRN
jgi:hypothetical protein